MRHARPIAVGLNCALGAALMRPYIEELAKVAGDTWISCYPNAGLPNPMSETGFDETPEVTGSLLEEFARAGFLNIAGGCCGTTPQHIARSRAGWATTGRAAGTIRCSRRCLRLPDRGDHGAGLAAVPRLPGNALVGGGRFLSSSLSIATGPGITRNVTASPCVGASTTTRRPITPRPCR